MITTITRLVKLSASGHRNLDRCLEHLQELYNSALTHRKQTWEEEQRGVQYNEQQALLTQARARHEEFRQWSVFIQRSILRRLDRAYTRFFKYGGFPRFKSSQRGIHSFEIDLVPKIKQKNKWSWVTLKGLGKFRFRGSLPEGEIKLLRVVKTTQRVKLQFVMECPYKEMEDTRAPVGIDVGIKNRLALSTGTVEPKRVLDRSEIIKRQRSVSKAKKGSQNRQKKINLLRKAWQRVTEQEIGYLHELTKDLVKNVSSTFVVEDLKIPNLIKNKHLSRSIIEQQWGRFIQMLTYKAERAGGQVMKVNPKFTSQMCSSCGYKPEQKIGLQVRTYNCSACGLDLDRDVNAAKNILQRGLATLMGGRPVASGGRRAKVVKLRYDVERYRAVPQ